jgi:hypothetical protein
MVLGVNGEVAQLICLAGHGSAWLAGGGGQEPPALDRENSTFRYVGSVNFRFAGPAGAESLAGDSAGWLAQLADRGARRIWLVLPEPRLATGPGRAADEYELAGFANAGDQSMLVTGTGQPEAWRAAWTVGDSEAPARRIWWVNYRGGHASDSTLQRPDPGAALDELTAALRSARDFAAGQELADWAEWFSRALTVGDDIDFHPDMLPAAHPPGARHLAAMAARAWVFGAMGSWNDQHFSQPEAEAHYREVSRRLYAAVRTAFLASVNGELAAAPDPA